MALLSSFKVYSSSVSTSAERVLSLFKSTIHEGGSAASAIRVLKAEGISYRRINMLEDFRRAGAIQGVRAGNITGEMRALDYFNDVVEPFRKSEGLSGKQAYDKIHTWERAQYDTWEEAEQAEEEASRYGFRDSPLGLGA